MTIYYKLKSATAKLFMSAGALALIAGLSMGTATPAYADDCLLDSNDDGDVDLTDTDGGADSGGINARLACGVNAVATGVNSTALGRDASAIGVESTALGESSSAAGFASTAVGKSASAAETASTALGNTASAAGSGSTALGYFASAAGINSTAVGRSANTAGLNSIAMGRQANAAGDFSTALGFSTSAAGTDSTALGSSASAAGNSSTALGKDANAAGLSSTAIGRNASAAGSQSTALGNFAETDLLGTTSVGYSANNGIAVGIYSTALGFWAKTSGTNAIAIGADGDTSFIGASAAGTDSIVIGTDAGDGGFAGAIVIGKDGLATETDQVILKSASTFTILGNGNMGLGTAAPTANLDIDSGGAVDTTLLLSNTVAQWELKNKASTGRLVFKNLTVGGVPFKLGPTAVNGLLSVGTAMDDLVEVRGDFDVTGILTTGGPTCGGGCDAVFDVDYDLPSIEEHAALMFANKHLPEIGPTVPLAPINLSEQYGRVINELEKAHIYIAELNREKQTMQAEMVHMKQQIAYLMNQ